MVTAPPSSPPLPPFTVERALGLRRPGLSLICGLFAAAAAALSPQQALAQQVQDGFLTTRWHKSPPPEAIAGPNPRVAAWANGASGEPITYVAGSKIADANANLRQIALWAYAPDGTPIHGFPTAWPPETPGATGEYYGLTVETLATGIYVAGIGPGGGTGIDTFLVKFDYAGNFIWKAQFDHAKGTDKPVRILSHACHDVIVVGTCDTETRSSDFYLARFDPVTGALIQAITHDGGFGLADTAVDAAIIAVSEFDPENGTGAPCNPSLPPDVGYVLAITGVSHSPTTGPDYMTVGYVIPNTCGMPYTLQWDKRYNNDAVSNSVDMAVSMAAGDNAFIVTGHSQADPATGSTQPDYVTIRYRLCDGDKRWVNRWNGFANGADIPRRVATPNAGQFRAIGDDYVYVTGGTWSGLTGFDAGTIAIDVETGDFVWEHFYRSAGGSGEDFGMDVAAIAGGARNNDVVAGVYVTAQGVDDTGNVHFATYRLKRSVNAGSGTARLHWTSPPVAIMSTPGSDVPTTLLLREWRELVGQNLVDLSDIMITGPSWVSGMGATHRYIQVP